jgi:hypothetical protein
MTEPLSPAAQAAKDHFLANVPISLEHGLAGALRAVADQVVPEDPPTFVDGGRSSEEQWMAKVESSVRQQLLAIAAELEGGND